VVAQTPFPLEPGVSQTMAKWRAANYSDVRYKLNITLEKGAPLMKGEIEIRVNLTEEGAKNDLVLDWRTTQFANDKDKPFANVVAVNATGAQASPLAISSQDDKKAVRADALNASGTLALQSLEHLIIPKGLLKTGENIIKIEFASPIKTSGAAITRYVDREDGAEYIYSLFVPSDASTAFPVFDQPDLKARFQLNVTAPYDWLVVSNMDGKSSGLPNNDKDSKNTKEEKSFFFNPERKLTEFKETQPISPYVFAFAAGDFEVFSESDFSKELTEFREPRIRMKSRFAIDVDKNASPNVIQIYGVYEGAQIYVRKSQAEKFKQHAAEVFRLHREGVKYLESYFDFKFPFPKYDLVLIPEFPFRGMEHAGATFLREDSIIFPSEPTANDFLSRANVIFHEAAHQWFGDTVTMKWFDDLWLKEGFAEFMAYKTLEKVMPEYNAWKAFYERNKPLAYATDSTRGTTPIYQEIPNLSAAKSAYGNIVYRKAPSFLRQAEFFLGEDKFQTAVRAFLKKYQYKNAEWTDLVREFEEVKLAETKKGEYYQKLSDGDKAELEKFTRWSISKEWAEFWVEKRGTAIYRISPKAFDNDWQLEWFLRTGATGGHTIFYEGFSQAGILKDENYNWLQDVKVLKVFDNGEREEATAYIGARKYASLPDEESKPRQEYKFEIQETEESRKKYEEEKKKREARKTLYVFPNYQDYGYGIFLLDDKSREYVLKNIQNEKEDFLRSMMWGALWDSVREAELAPKDYVELVIKNFGSELRLQPRNDDGKITPKGVTLNIVEKDELTIQTILSRVSTAMNYYLSEAQAKELAPKLEDLLIDKMQNAPTLGQRITFYRAFLNTASTEKARTVLKELLKGAGGNASVNERAENEKSTRSLTAAFLPLKTKDKFDIVTRLAILGDADAPKILEDLRKADASDDAKRYAYAVGAGFGTKESKEKYFNDFLSSKDISESWIESAFVPFNSPRHSELTLPFLERALAELPNLKRNRKIFFVNGWLAVFIGGQKDEKALAVVNKFLADNPNLDKDLRLKILENLDVIERSIRIRSKFGKN
jgi:aminopeptidase N